MRTTVRVWIFAAAGASSSASVWVKALLEARGHHVVGEPELASLAVVAAEPGAAGVAVAAARTMLRTVQPMLLAVVDTRDATAAAAAGADELLVTEDSPAETQARLAILERRLAERAQRERAEEQTRRLGKALETMSLGVTVVDAGGQLVYANEAEAAMHGYTVEEYMRLDVRALSPGADRLAGSAPVDRRYRRWERERVRIRKDGTHFPVKLCSDVVRGVDGEPEGLVTTCEDISERRRVEEVAEATREQYRQFFEGHLAGAVILDGDGRLADCNAAFATLVGASDREAVVGHHLSVYLRAPGQVESLVGQLLAGGKIARQEMELTRADGSVATVLASLVAPAASPAMGFFVDVTEQKTLEAQLRQALKMDAVGKLAGGVAHDFNNFLVVIGGYAEQMLETLDPTDPRHRWAAAMVRTAEKASSLTRQLLAFSRRDVVQPRVLQLDPLVTDVVSMVGRLLGAGIEVETVAGTGVANVKIDPGQFEQVLMNLAVNARDAMAGKGGRLTISTSNAVVDVREARQQLGLKPGAYVLLEVRDTGCGMSAETINRIFEPFFTTKPLGQGTGLGLAMVYGIVKQANGYIAVSSVVGEGTTFRIYLPAVDAPAEVMQEVPTALPLDPSEHAVVLLVEDDADARTLVAQMLRRRGYDVVEAVGPADALAVCESEQRVDLLLTDVVMPQMNGPQLAAAASARRPSLRVLYMTGYTDQDIGFGTVVPADVAILRKPFRIDVLVRRVRETLSARAVAAV